MKEEKIVSSLPSAHLAICICLCFQDFNDHLQHVAWLSVCFGKSELMPTSTPLEHFSGSIVMSSQKHHKDALPDDSGERKNNFKSNFAAEDFSAVSGPQWQHRVPW